MASRRIDVHHHMIPDFYAEAVTNNGGDPSGASQLLKGSGRMLPEWSRDSEGKFQETWGIATSMLSLSAPGACIEKDPVAAAKLARRATELAASMRDKEPDKFGVFGSVASLLDKESTLEEIAYAFDELNADGLTLFTRYGPDNHYLGHPDFKYVWDELDRRHAVVFIHPTHPVDCAFVNPSLPLPLLDYAFETTKTAVDLIMSRTVRDHPNVKIILSHGGGTLPYIVARPASVMWRIDPSFKTEDFIEDARSMYYDTALSGNEGTLMLLEKFCKPDHLLYGSDYAYAGPKSIGYHTGGLDNYQFKDQHMVQKVNRENALALFPRLK